MNGLRRFMYGRYGGDVLNIVLIISAFVISIIHFPFSFVVSIALIVIAFYRMFSRNIYKRQMENAAFLGAVFKIKNFFTGFKKRIQDRKYYKYYKCNSCGTKMRVPKGKGKIRITCPNCGKQWKVKA